MNALQHLKDTVMDTIATRPEMTMEQIRDLTEAVDAAVEQDEWRGIDVGEWKKLTENLATPCNDEFIKGFHAAVDMIAKIETLPTRPKGEGYA